MLYFFQTLSLKTRFLTLILLFFPVLLFQWLLMAAPWAQTTLKLLSHGTGVPDELFWYNPSMAQQIFAAWGPGGRAHYLSVLWPTDLGFLLAYGLFLTTATLYLLKKVNPHSFFWYLLPLVPLAGAACDLFENLTVAAASLLPSEGWEPVSWIATGFTSAKWSLLGLSGAVLVVGTLGFLLRTGWNKVKALAGSSDDDYTE